VDEPRDPWLTAAALARGEQPAVEDAIRYLEADPWAFRSGYAKATLFRRLRHVDLDGGQADRLRWVLLHHVDVGPRWELREASSLARHLDDELLRRALRTRLHGDDDGIAMRALIMLLRVRRPGLDERDLDAGRALLLRSAQSEPWWPGRVVAGRIRRLWSAEWGGDLVAMADERDDPSSVAARRLLREVPRLADRARGAGP
jgi:hypothetical protein